MATLEDSNNDRNLDLSPNIHALAGQVSLMSYQIVEQSSIISSSKLPKTERSTEFSFRPTKTDKNIALTQDYLIDLALRIEKMCGIIFSLNTSTNS